MKVYKKDVYDFLEKVESKAVNSIHKKYDAMILQSKTERTTKYIQEIRDFATKLEVLFLESNDLVNNYKDLYGNSTWTNLSFFNSNLRSALNCCNSIEPKEIKENGYEKQLLLEKQEQLEAVKKEYAKLKHYAKNNTAKEAYVLLKEIGFDVTSLEQKENVLIAKADKSKLFVCGENK